MGNSSGEILISGLYLVGNTKGEGKLLGRGSRDVCIVKYVCKWMHPYNWEMEVCCFLNSIPEPHACNLKNVFKNQLRKVYIYAI